MFIIAVLLALLLPSVSAAREDARRVKCQANLHQLSHAFIMYANDYRGRVMPLAYSTRNLIGDGPVIYWWGTNDEVVDHTRGFAWPYLQSELRNGSVFECPSQPWGSYRPQGSSGQPTSTYGYNGYYLSPPHTPGWSNKIGQRPWRTLDTTPLPQRVLAFADTALDVGDDQPQNNALLDPPMLYQGRGRWRENESPTTSFRHRGRTNGLHVDGHVESMGVQSGRMTSPKLMIGSVTDDADPKYVPDWRDWTE